MWFKIIKLRFKSCYCRIVLEIREGEIVDFEISLLYLTRNTLTNLYTPYKMGELGRNTLDTCPLFFVRKLIDTLYIFIHWQAIPYFKEV